MATMTGSSPLSILRSRSREDAAGGVPVGAVFLPCRRQIQRCRGVLEAATSDDKKFRFRNIDFLPEGGAVCHLPVSAAAVMIDAERGRTGDATAGASAAVAAFMVETGAE